MTGGMQQLDVPNVHLVYVSLYFFNPNVGLGVWVWVCLHVRLCVKFK